MTGEINIRRSGNWMFWQVVALSITIFAYGWISSLSSEVTFIPAFAILFVATLSVTLIQYALRKKRFWAEMPAYMSMYILFALFIPTLWLYSSKILKTLLEWNDMLILEACALGCVFIQVLWFSYDLGKIILPDSYRRGRQLYVSWTTVVILMGISILTALVAIFTGTFGVLQNVNLEETANFSQYIDQLQQFGILGLIALTFFHPHRRVAIAVFTMALFFIGVLAAHKQAALMPLFAVGLTYFLRTKRIPLKLGVIGLFAVFLAFSVVGMIRQFYFDRYGDGVSSLAEVAHISRNAIGMEEFNRAYEVYDVGDQIIMRIFYGNAIGKAIQHCDRNGYGVPEDSRLAHVLLAPVYAVVPRIIYSDKPSATFGNWFAVNVAIRERVKYSIGITPVGYGYMVSGIWGVALVAAILGVFMALVHTLLYHRFFVIYVFLIVRLILPPDVTWEYISGSIKIVLVAWIVLNLLNVRWSLRGGEPGRTMLSTS